MHATSFAYFAKTGDESAKKLLIDPNYQLLSSNAQEKVEGDESTGPRINFIHNLLRGYETNLDSFKQKNW